MGNHRYKLVKIFKHQRRRPATVKGWLRKYPEPEYKVEWRRFGRFFHLDFRYAFKGYIYELIEEEIKEEIEEEEKELIFCIPDLPDKIFQAWQKTAGFEFFFPLNKVSRTGIYQTYINFICKEDYPEGDITKKKEWHTTFVIGERMSPLTFQKQCPALLEIALYCLNHDPMRKCSAPGNPEKGIAPGWQPEYVFCKDESATRLPDEEYDKWRRKRLKET